MPDGSGVIPLGFVDDIEGEPGTTGGGYAYDDHGHGTEMVGLVGANANGAGAIGVMPDGRTYSLKTVFNTHVRAAWHCGFWVGSESYFCIETDDLVRAVDFACANGIRVLSMSWGGDMTTTTNEALYHAYTSCDILLLAAVGNEPEDAGTAPAKYAHVMGIGGLDGNGRSVYQNMNEEVSVYSMGHTLRGSCPMSSYCTPNGNGLSDGTSASTATAAGIAGLVRAYNPALTAPQVRQRLISTAMGPLLQVDAEYAVRNIAAVRTRISGPVRVPPGEMKTWTAAPSGGTPGYTYRWYRDEILVSSSASYIGSAWDYGFQLRLVVTDSRLRTAETTIVVSIEEPSCSYEPSPGSIVCPT